MHNIQNTPIIDFHTHVFPDALAARALESLLVGVERARGYRAELYSDGTVAGLLECMAREAVALSLIMPIATKPTHAPSLNKFAAAQASDRIIPFGSIHPAQEDWEAALDDICALGLRGIKLHPEFQDFYPDSPRGIDILRKATELGLIVLYHAGEDLGYLPPVRSSPERLRRAIDAAPDARVVAAHMGGMWMWDEARKYLLDTPIYFDTAYVHHGLPLDEGRDLIRARGADKVLLASDSPWTRPRADALGYLRETGLSDAEIELICHVNAEKLLGIAAL